MYYLKNGAKAPLLAALYALATVLASFGIGNLCQSNSVSTVLAYEFGVPGWLTGLILAFLCGLIILRGIRGIAKFTSVAIPIIDALFLLCGVFAILANFSRLPGVFSLIWQDAFRPIAAGGGLLGALVSCPCATASLAAFFPAKPGWERIPRSCLRRRRRARPPRHAGHFRGIYLCRARLHDKRARAPARACKGWRALPMPLPPMKLPCPALDAILW